MINQIKPLLAITLKPKQTILSLPSDRFFIVSYFISLYFAYSRALRQGTLNRLSSQLSSQISTYIFFLVMTAIGFMLGALILKAVTQIFGKKLTFKKVMNIIGYTQAPRLLISLPATIIFAVVGMNQLFLIIFGILGLIMLLYSLFLLFYALKITPSN